jgi:hypothetical protein
MTVYYKTGVDDIIDTVKLVATQNKKSKIGRLPTIVTNCQVTSLTVRQLRGARRRFCLQSTINKSSGMPVGVIDCVCLMDGRHFVSLSTGSVSRFEDYHIITLKWGDIFFQTTLGKSGTVILQINPVNFLQVGLPQVTRDGQKFGKFNFSYESALNNCDEGLINAARTAGARIIDSSQAGCCLIL